MGKAKPAKKPAKSPAPAAKAKAPQAAKAKVAEFEQLTIPVSALSYNPKINARGDAQTDIEQLAMTIKVDGLVQPISVRPAGKKFEPLEGGRRFRAIEHLIRNKAPGWTVDTLIPVYSRKMTDAEALEASLAAHVTHLDLTPAQQAIAFRDLQREGRSVEEIATTYMMSERLVLQRLAIGSLPATILKALKAGEIDTKTAEAFTLTNDASAQLKLFTNLAGKRNLNHQSVRQQLTGKATSANDGHARFVGEKIYVAAGGTITADLFGEDRWFENGKLLGRLFDEKVQEKAKALEAEGWSFVKVERDHWHDFYNWGRIQPKGKPSPEDKKRVAELDKEITRVEKRMDEIQERDSYREDAALWNEYDELEEKTLPSLQDERDSIPVAPFTPEQKAKAGVILNIAPGRFEIMYGMVDPAVSRAERSEETKKAKEKEKKKAKEKREKAIASGQTPEPEEPDFSGALKADLSKYLGGALQVAIADKPQAAQFLLIATLLADAMEEFSYGSRVIAIKGTPYSGGNSSGNRYYGEQLELTKGAHEFQIRLQAEIKKLFPEREGKKKGGRHVEEEITLEQILAKLELLDHQDLMRLQALLVARALNISMDFATDADAVTLLKRVDPEVGKWWTPDKEFFGRLKKPDLVDALGEAAVANIPKSGSKGQLVELAVEKLPGTGWLPKPLRAPSYAGPGSNAWADAQGAKVADAGIEQAPMPVAAE